MQLRKEIIWATVAAFLIMTVPAFGFEVGVRGFYWIPKITGDIRVDDDGIDGTRIDLEDDLDIESDGYPGAEAFIGLGSHHISLAYYRAKVDGEEVLSRDINFAGETFNISESVDSELEYDAWDFQYRWDFLDLENILAGFSLGLVGRIQVFDGSAEIESSTLRAATDFTIAAPMAGLGFNAGILADWIEVRAIATGMSYGDGTIFDGQADISFTPFPFFDIHGGYRYFMIDVDEDDIELDSEIAGPFVGVTISF